MHWISPKRIRSVGLNDARMHGPQMQKKTVKRSRAPARSRAQMRLQLHYTPSSSPVDRNNYMSLQLTLCALSPTTKSIINHATVLQHLTRIACERATLQESTFPSSSNLSIPLVRFQCHSQRANPPPFFTLPGIY
jgi:hypothetical protein